MFHIVDDYIKSVINNQEHHNKMKNGSNGIFIGVPHNDIDFHIHLGEAIMKKVIVIGMVDDISVLYKSQVL